MDTTLVRLMIFYTIICSSVAMLFGALTEKLFTSNKEMAIVVSAISLLLGIAGIVITGFSAKRKDNNSEEDNQ